MSGVTNWASKTIQDVGSGLGLIEGTTSKDNRRAQETDTARQKEAQRRAEAAAKVQQDEIAAVQATQKAADDTRAGELEAANQQRATARRGRRSLLQFVDTGALGTIGTQGSGLSQYLGGKS